MIYYFSVPHLWYFGIEGCFWVFVLKIRICVLIQNLKVVTITRHFLLKHLYQDRKVSGYVFVYFWYRFLPLCYFSIGVVTLRTVWCFFVFHFSFKYHFMYKMFFAWLIVGMVIIFYAYMHAWLIVGMVIIFYAYMHYHSMPSICD